ncbi:MAG: FAD-dependent oxidoreductase [Methanomassiliicoccales archaeon]|nr:FAD-dependent oxidoreductase [Methanomassiliicoccales archaeon]
MNGERHFDITVIGGGVLGTCIAYWLTSHFDGSVALVEMESNVAVHASSRNTGVVHRPFYLDPVKKKIFALSAQKSYGMWKRLSETASLPWRQHGTLEICLHEEDVPRLSVYMKWGRANGMGEEELVLLDRGEAGRIEPDVRCSGALLCRTDAAVDYGAFTRAVMSICRQNGLHLLLNSKLTGIESSNGRNVLLLNNGDTTLKVTSDFVINAAGGNAVDIAHRMGLGMQYTDIHFRGDYWKVLPDMLPSVRHNIYSLPAHSEFPFLDPHFVIRHDGGREIGPNAAMVAGPYQYSGMIAGLRQLLSKAFERPLLPKAKLAVNAEFISLARSEWRSSLSRDAMCGRVQKFIPSLRPDMLQDRGFGGIRSNLIDRKGFVPEAVVTGNEQSLHVLNYNSPGATGAPAYSAYLVGLLKDGGFLDHMRLKTGGNRIWNFDEAAHMDG